MNKTDIDWGDLPAWLVLVPAWLTFVATAAAVVAAVFAGIKAGDLLKVERDRDRVADSERIARQASRVAAWAAPGPPSSVGTYLARYSSGVRAIAVNLSDEPIYDVSITWWHANDAIRTDGADLIPPGESREWHLPRDAFEELVGLPGVAGAMFGNAEQAEGVSRTAADQLRIEIAFTDSANRRWVRSATGALRLQSEQYRLPPQGQRNPRA